MKSVSIVAPLHNEQEVLPELVKRLTAVARELDMAEIVLVDDGSTDRTFAMLEEACGRHGQLRGVRLTRNFGQHAAITAGLANSTGDLVVLLDGDLQDPPEEIPKLLATADETGADVIYGLREERKDRMWRRASSAVFKGLLRKALPGGLPPNVGTFRVLSRRVVDAFLALPERGRYVTGLIDWLGFPRAFHPYRRAERGAGSPSYGVRGLIRLALRGMTAFSAWPIHACAYAGSLLAGGSLLVALVFIVKRVVFGSGVTGFTATIVAVTFLGGVQLLFLGMVGLYVSRIFDEVKARPIYVVDRVVGGDDDAAS